MMPYSLQGYSVYLAVLYGMVALLAVNVFMCVWVAWCFKEHKFPVVWPIKVRSCAYYSRDLTTFADTH